MPRLLESLAQQGIVSGDKKSKVGVVHRAVIVEIGRTTRRHGNTFTVEDAVRLHKHAEVAVVDDEVQIEICGTVDAQFPSLEVALIDLTRKLRVSVTTVLNQLGVDHTKLTYRYQGRDFRLTDVHGHVVKDILK